MEEDKKQQQPIGVDLRPDVARGSYSNLAIITHSSSEFVLDFAVMLLGHPKPEVTNRIIMSPEHCKRLLNTLGDNISKYERRFGEIEIEHESNLGGISLANLNGNGTKS